LTAGLIASRPARPVAESGSTRRRRFCQTVDPPGQIAGKRIEPALRLEPEPVAILEKRPEPPARERAVRAGRDRAAVYPEPRDKTVGDGHMCGHQRRCLKSDLRRTPVEQQRAAGGDQRNGPPVPLQLPDRNELCDGVDCLLPPVLECGGLVACGARGDDARVDVCHLCKAGIELPDGPGDPGIGAAAQRLDLLRCGVHRGGKGGRLAQNRVQPRVVFGP
jgi:hypothetical protein